MRTTAEFKGSNSMLSHRVIVHEWKLYLRNSVTLLR
jgi:hypothetical protein